MKKNNFDIIFMGTSDFSVPALRAISQTEHNIQLVITQPDRPKGRGMKTSSTPVKKTALELGIQILQPENINIPSVVEKLKSLKPDLFVVAAFGQKLSEEILSIPTIFPLNIHASLLPFYRGSSPIQAAILNLDKKTGVTTMVMGKNLDTGDILLSSKTNIGTDETAGELYDRLADIGGQLICETIEAISNNTVTPIPQDHKLATYAPMLKKNDGKINWEESSKKICAKIRAMTPWPGAFACLGGKTLKIFKASSLKSNRTDKTPGTIIECQNNEILIASGNGIVNIIELLGKSGKRLTAKEFLRGNKLKKDS